MTGSFDDKSMPSGEYGLTLLSLTPVSDRARRAHETKNLASCVSAIAGLLELETADAEASVRERIGRLRALSARLAELMRSELGEELSPPAPPVRAPFCMLSAAREVVANARERALDAGVQIQLVGDPANLTGDRTALVEALFNLVSNAIDATPRGGSITISTKTTPSGDHEWIVRDSGCGMSEQKLSELGRVCQSTKVGGSGFVSQSRRTPSRNTAASCTWNPTRAAGPPSRSFSPAS